MTNRFDAYPDALPGGGFRVLIRFAKDGEAKPLLERGEKPRIFPTEKEAWKASTEALCSYLNGSLTCSGHKMSKARSELDRIFRKGGKVVGVERKESRA